jgi:signal transduction histidine kinase
MEAAMSAVEDSNPWLAADLRDAASQKRLVAGLILAVESADRAREAAERANLAKSRLLTAATDELRQSLQSLSRLNGTLRRRVSKPEAADAVRQQEQVIGAMSQLLNTVLDISKLDSGALRPELTHRLRTLLSPEDGRAVSPTGRASA